MTPLTLSLRQRKLVHYLQLQSAYTTGQELASQLQVSARTIRNDIAEINQILNGTGIRIASKRSEGYLLVSSNQDQLKELSRTSSSFLSRDERVRHIAFRLCLSDEPVNLYDLEDEMLSAEQRWSMTFMCSVPTISFRRHTLSSTATRTPSLSSRTSGSEGRF